MTFPEQMCTSKLSHSRCLFLNLETWTHKSFSSHRKFAGQAIENEYSGPRFLDRGENVGQNTPEDFGNSHTDGFAGRT